MSAHFSNSAYTWYIANVCGGMVLEHNKERAKLTIPKGNPTQLWRLHEKLDGAGNQLFSFQNVDTGNYMRADSAAGWSAITTGEQQWWKPEKAQAVGAVYLKCIDFPNAYLCNYNGAINDGNNAEIWTMDSAWLPALGWYIKAYERPVAIEVHDVTREYVGEISK